MFTKYITLFILFWLEEVIFIEDSPSHKISLLLFLYLNSYNYFQLAFTLFFRINV